MKKIIKIIIIILISLNINIKNIQAKVLPKIFLEGNIDKMDTKQDERKIKLKYISNDLEFTSYIKIKPQGNSSMAYKKKNYTIKLYEDNKYTNKKNIDFGWGKQHKYNLKANWIDKTHSRNIVTANIIASIQKKYNLFMNSPNNNQIDGFPVEVYSNNEFLGLYTWNIPKDNWTFNMDNNNPNHIVMEANSSNESTNFKEEATQENWEIEVGQKNEETLKKFNRVLNFIKDSSNQEFKEDFNKYLNLDATLNYYCILQYIKSHDNVNKNLLMITYDGKIWAPILYDLDTTWGTHWTGTQTTSYTTNLNNGLNESLLWKKFQENFPNEIANRYFELRKSILTKENIIKQFKKYYQTIPTDTLIKEQEKWSNIPGYDISQIEDFINARTQIIDRIIYDMYDTTPTINIEYSTKELTLKPVTVKLNTNRNDIIIIKNNKQSYDYSYIFKENGEYTYEYQDWFGNYVGTITININNIRTKHVLNILSSVSVIIIGTTLYILSKKKKKKEDSSNTKNLQKKSSTKKSTSKKKNETNKTNQQKNQRKKQTKKNIKDNKEKISK